MREFRDYEGRQVFLLEFDERHIAARHPDLAALGLYDVIGEVLVSPDVVIYHGRAFHHFRMRRSAPNAGRYVRVVVESENGDRYVRTAHFTGRLIHGEVIWEREK